MLAVVRELIARIEEAADPRVAADLARFFQVRPGGYGEGDQFAGVRISTLRPLLSPYRTQEFRPREWLPLLRSPIHEHRAAALVVMSERAGRGAETERHLLYDTYLDHTAYVNNWDLVDASAPAIVGGWLATHDRTPLDRLARSTTLWERRIAMVATQRLIGLSETADTYRLALLLRADRHDLIHKATGWMLREAGKRVDADELRRFLDAYAPTLPRTALRYAIEHFPPAERGHYLALR